MEAVLIGQKVEQTLSASDVLTQAVQELSEAVARMGNVPVIPIGRAAALIVGAAVVGTQGRIRTASLPAHGGADHKAIVVEAVAVGEGNVERTVQAVRRDGADWVGVWIWRADEGLSDDRTGADEVVATRYSTATYR